MIVEIETFARQNSVNLRTKFWVTRELIIRTYSIQALISYQNVTWNWSVSPFRRCVRKFCRFYSSHLPCAWSNSVLRVRSKSCKISSYPCHYRLKNGRNPWSAYFVQQRVLSLLVGEDVITLDGMIHREKMFHEISMEVDHQQHDRLIQIFKYRELSVKCNDLAAYQNYLDNLRL